MKWVWKVLGATGETIGRAHATPSAAWKAVKALKAVGVPATVEKATVPA